MAASECLTLSSDSLDKSQKLSNLKKKTERKCIYLSSHTSKIHNLSRQFCSEHIQYHIYFLPEYLNCLTECYGLKPPRDGLFDGITTPQMRSSRLLPWFPELMLAREVFYTSSDPAFPLMWLSSVSDDENEQKSRSSHLMSHQQKSPNFFSCRNQQVFHLNFAATSS